MDLLNKQKGKIRRDGSELGNIDLRAKTKAGGMEILE
jgi:hypothetical protein